MYCFDFEVKSSKVSVMTRPDMVKKSLVQKMLLCGKGLPVDGLPSKPI